MNLRSGRAVAVQPVRVNPNGVMPGMGATWGVEGEDGGTTGAGAGTGISAGSRSGSDGKIAASGAGGVAAVPPLKFSQKILAQATVASVWRAYQHLVRPV